MVRLLIDVAKQIKPIVIRATMDLGSDLGGMSVIDLCADQIPDVSLFDIKCALVVAGIDHHLSKRLVRSYSK